MPLSKNCMCGSTSIWTGNFGYDTNQSGERDEEGHRQIWLTLVVQSLFTQPVPPYLFIQPSLLILALPTCLHLQDPHHQQAFGHITHHHTKPQWHHHDIFPWCWIAVSQFTASSIGCSHCSRTCCPLLGLHWMFMWH
jgi:hypothetical protein